MNSLSLRLSSIKNSDNLKKNSEIRVALLELPPKYDVKIPKGKLCRIFGLCHVYIVPYFY